MNMLTRFGLFALILMSACLMACEGNTRLEWSLENESSGNVIVIHDASDYDFFDTLHISAGEARLLGQNDYLGGHSLPFDPFSFIDTLLIYNDSGQISSKDWEQTLNWQIESFQDRKMPSQWRHTYLLTIDDGDV